MHSHDNNREVLFFEHLYTGTMFREDLNQLFNEEKLCVVEISKLIRSKYNICLITQDENKNLHKTHRGANPLEYYQKVGKITIVNLNK